ncbi:MAG: helix-turn-helix domain-containing protein [Candidatus Rokuibacteriota bacterium]
MDSSAAAERRLEVMRWYEAHGRNARLTARHFGFSPDTISRWVRAFPARGVRGLEDRSRRPHRVRTPTTPLRVVERVRQLREKYPRWGREKLSVLLAREGIFVSGKTVDRVLERLRRSGELREPRVVQKSLERRRERMKRLARPSGLIVDRPGFLQLDTQDIRGDGRRAFTFAAVDHLTRKRILGAAARITSEAGALFFDRAVREFPFPIWAVQTDGGSEFKGAFAAAAAAAGIPHYVNRPNYPQGQGRVERSFLTDVLECYEVDDPPRGIAELEQALREWNHVYEQIRPHQALGYLTPNEFYARWSAEHAGARG